VRTFTIDSAEAGLDWGGGGSEGMIAAAKAVVGSVIYCWSSAIEIGGGG
jgi:hypothetical protein